MEGMVLNCRNSLCSAFIGGLFGHVEMSLNNLPGSKDSQSLMLNGSLSGFDTAEAVSALTAPEAHILCFITLWIVAVQGPLTKPQPWTSEVTHRGHL